MNLPIPSAALDMHVIALGKTRSGKSSKLRLLVEYLLERSKPVIIIDPKGDWWGLKSSATGKAAGYPLVIFGGEHADVPINSHSGAQVAELLATGNRSALIDLGGWTMGERTRFFIDFSAALFKMHRGERHLAIDEVHNFCPKGKVFSPEAGMMLHWANRLASEGQGKGIILLAASQRPQKVHNDFLTSCETLIACKVIHKADRDAIKDWIDGCADPAIGKKVLEGLPQLEKPEAWVWSPETKFGPVLVKWPMFQTYDSFKQQPVGIGKLTGWAEVDLEEVKTRLGAVVDEAIRNDPKLLRMRIAELESARAVDPQWDRGEVMEIGRRQGDKEGYERGFAAARDEAIKQTFDLVFQKVTDALGSVSRTVESLKGAKAPYDPPQHSDAVIQKALAEKRPPTAFNMIKPAAEKPGSSNLGKAERKILTALAQYQNGRTKTQVAILTGYASTGGGFNNALGSLRSQGFMEGSLERLEITDAGRKVLGPFTPLPHGRELLDHWMNQLGKAERSILRSLVMGGPMSKPLLAANSGYEPTGGGFNNALGKLRSLELIYGSSELRASEDLFS